MAAGPFDQPERWRRGPEDDEYLGTADPFMPHRPRSDFDDTRERVELPYGGDVGPSPERLAEQAFGVGGEGGFEREIRRRYGLPEHGHGTRAGQRFRGVGPRGYVRPDRRIYEDVCDGLAEHPAVDASEVDVRVVGGDVFLKGEVRDRKSKRLIEDIVAGVRGVHDVHNELRVLREAR